MFRPYDPDRDFESVKRIWTETGWIEDEKAPGFKQFLDLGRAVVADVNGDAECLVVTTPGTIRYLKDDLPFNLVAGVTTSRVTRRQGLAGRLTAQSIAADVADGSVVAGLGMFEQGFYNKLGFGTGPHMIRVCFDPGMIRGVRLTRSPCRLTTGDYEEVHANRLIRRRGHGACNFPASQASGAEMEMGRNGFGLGFRDGPNNTLSHHVWLAVRESVEDGPYIVRWMAYRTVEQFKELMAVLESLGDQVRLMRMWESGWVQLQDFLHCPFQRVIVTRGSDFDSRTLAMAWWQARICDVPACIAAVKLNGGEVRFNLTLTDPIERYLPDDAPWRGVAGQYVVTLGTSSGVEPGYADGLPEMKASVNAFSRIWLGVRPASGIAASDDVEAPTELLEQLDDVLRLPSPNPDWEF